MTQSLHVAFKGADHELPLPLGAATTVAQAQQVIADALDVPADAQRWIQRKKKVNTATQDQLLVDVCGDTRDAKIFLLAGASSAQIDTMRAAQQSVEAEQRARYVCCFTEYLRVQRN